jgi:hypothetical protein
VSQSANVTSSAVAGVGRSGPATEGEVVLGSLLEAAHRLAPDDVVPTVVAHLAALGMTDAVVYVVDLDQRVLVLVGEPAHTFDIDASAPGAVFRTQQVLAEPAPTGEGARLWVPLIDGSDRVGVMGVTVAVADDHTVERARHMASVTAGLIVSKSVYGDNLVLTARLRDMDLAAEMRWSMLPPLTFTNDRVAIAGMLEPAYEIAGDAFDYAVNGDVAHVAIVDAMGHVPAEVAEVALEPGDAVLFMTDGVLEARSPDGAFFGRTRLARLWAEAAGHGDLPAEIMRRLCHSVLDHQQGRLQDDATLLLVVWTGPR